MKFQTWLESTNNFRSTLVDAIEAIASRDRSSIGILGDLLHDSGNHIGQVMIGLFNGNNPFVKVPANVRHGEDYCDVPVKVELSPVLEITSYSYFHSNKYAVTLRTLIDNSSIYAMELQVPYPNSNVRSGTNAILRRNHIMRAHKLGMNASSVTTSIIPKFFSVPAPSEEVLMTILQTLLATYNKL